jgi:hypothetical protein
LIERTREEFGVSSRTEGGLQGGERIDRRRFLGLFALTTAVLGDRKAWADNARDDDLLDVIAGPVALREPTLTGKLIGDERAQLLQLFQCIGARWDMAGTGVGEAQFADLVDSKTSERPSYLTEYREAAALIARIRANDRPQVTLDALLTPGRDVVEIAATRLGRFQKYVSSEFITWFIVRGGFRRFGYIDYCGYGGGPFSDPAHLPYRALSGGA